MSMKKHGILEMPNNKMRLSYGFVDPDDPFVTNPSITSPEVPWDVLPEHPMTFKVPRLPGPEVYGQLPVLWHHPAVLTSWNITPEDEAAGKIQQIKNHWDNDEDFTKSYIPHKLLFRQPRIPWGTPNTVMRIPKAAILPYGTASFSTSLEHELSTITMIADEIGLFLDNNNIYLGIVLERTNPDQFIGASALTSTNLITPSLPFGLAPSGHEIIQNDFVSPGTAYGTEDTAIIKHYVKRIHEEKFWGGKVLFLMAETFGTYVRTRRGGVQTGQPGGALDVTENTIKVYYDVIGHDVASIKSAITRFDKVKWRAYQSWRTVTTSVGEPADRLNHELQESKNNMANILAEYVPEQYEIILRHPDFDTTISTAAAIAARAVAQAKLYAQDIKDFFGGE